MTTSRHRGFPTKKVIADVSVAIVVSILGYVAGFAKLGIEASKETKVPLIPLLLAFALLLGLVIVAIYFRMRTSARAEFAEKSAQITSEHEGEIARLKAEHAEDIHRLEVRLTEQASVIQRREFDLFKQRTDKHHKFIHMARDIAVAGMGKYPLISLNPKLGNQPVLGDIQERHHLEIKELLDRMATMFDLLVHQDTKVWVCIRQLTHSGEYRTCIRNGDHDTRRGDNTEGLPPNAAIVKKLSDMIKSNQECVLITGRHDPIWHGMPNDDLGETESVLVGAILLKNYDAHAQNKWVDKQMVWMLSLCADKIDAFDEGHKNLMKCCNDAVSWLLNGWVRAELSPAPTTPPGTAPSRPRGRSS